MHRSTSYYFH